jgi:MFS family permease
MQTFSPRTVAPYIVGRALLGFAQGLALPAAATYLSEMAPTRIRGRALSFYQLFYSVGSFIWYVDRVFFAPCSVRSLLSQLLVRVWNYEERHSWQLALAAAYSPSNCMPNHDHCVHALRT